MQHITDISKKVLRAIGMMYKLGLFVDKKNDLLFVLFV